jgi:hypothetical protein
MVEKNEKPLNWEPAADIGYLVERRMDGGLKVVFSDASNKTLEHWREFALSHLIDSDRLTRNLYDLRQIDKLPGKAVQIAVEVNNDPSVRNIRLAVVVSNDEVQSSVQEIQALTSPGGVEMAVFWDMSKAEEWLQRPLTMVV